MDLNKAVELHISRMVASQNAPAIGCIDYEPIAAFIVEFARMKKAADFAQEDGLFSAQDQAESRRKIREWCKANGFPPEALNV